MSTPSRWTKSTLIFGGAAIWGLLLVSCVTTSRTIMAPPSIPGATYVGSSKCSTCHEDVSHKFADATHAKLFADGGNAVETGCESCHGPGSLHVKAGGSIGTILNPTAETCYQCHLEKRGEFSLPNSHPIASGKMTCSDCHDPHAGNAVAEGGTSIDAINSSCVKCHVSQGGPYVFEHEASREGCTVCHNPHGTLNAKMLKARNSNLCLQCHYQQTTSTGDIYIGGRQHGGASGFLTRGGTCWSTGCHEAVHGSHISSSLRF